mgnify:CR=1 FL=1
MGSTTDELTNLASQLTNNPDRRELDLLLSTGELVSCTLTTMALQAIGKPAKSLSGWQAGIYTDSRYGKAQIKDIDISPIMTELQIGNIVIIAGFQGIDDGSDITTLGRGGSDTTAVAIAAALNADKCEIYTDVEGIYSADPRLVPSAQKLSHISYEEMLEMASYGAKMHPRSIELAMTYNVPIYVASSFTDNEGTLIHTGSNTKMHHIEEQRKRVISIATKSGYTKFTLTQVPNRSGLASQIFELLSEKDISVDEISMNAERGNTTDLTFTVDSVDRDITSEVLQQLKTKLNAGGVIISDWFRENTEQDFIKITVRFLSNEIRADGLKVIIHKKVCKKNDKENCKVIKDETTLGQEIKLAILKKATFFKKNSNKKKKKKS